MDTLAFQRTSFVKTLMQILTVPSSPVIWKCFAIILFWLADSVMASLSNADFLAFFGWNKSSWKTIMVITNADFLWFFSFEDHHGNYLGNAAFPWEDVQHLGSGCACYLQDHVGNLWMCNSTSYHSYRYAWHHLCSHHDYRPPPSPPSQHCDYHHHHHHHYHLNKAGWFHLLALNCLRPDQAHPLLSPGDSLKQQQISSQLSSSDSLKVMTTINITIVINIVINHCCLRHCTKVAALIGTSYMYIRTHT